MRSAAKTGASARPASSASRLRMASSMLTPRAPSHAPARMARMTAWPELHIADWRDTYATLQLYAQIVGKIRMALTPKTNEWWNVTLYVTPRGLTTSAMSYGERTLSIDFDFVDHQVVVVDSDGHTRRMSLKPMAVCDFHDALFAELAAIDVRV